MRGKLASRFFWLFIALIISSLPVMRASAEDLSSVVGLWVTVDDHTHKHRSVVKIWEENKNLHGKIEKIYYLEGEGPGDVCEKCDGDRHNKPILGMEILWGFTNVDDKLLEGYIIDPHNGKIYHCRLTLIDNGNKLDVHGYIGLPILGRSQVWERLDPKHAKQTGLK